MIIFASVVLFTELVSAVVGNQELSQPLQQQASPSSRSTNFVNIRRRLIPVNCSRPLMAQYNCSKPKIDEETQQPINCDKNNRAQVICHLYDGFVCDGTLNVTSFTRDIDCLYTNGYYFETTLLLSIFLGNESNDSIIALS